MWRESTFRDPHHRDDVDSIFYGHKYLYQWVPVDMTLRRYDLITGEETITRPRRRPRTGQELTQVFYNTRMSMRYSDKKIRKRTPLVAQDARDQSLPWSRVHVIDVRDLDLSQLTDVYKKLNPAWPSHHVFRAHVSATVRVAHALRDHEPGNPMCLVDRIPDGARSMSVYPRLHIVHNSSLPADHVKTRHARVFDDEAQLQPIVPNPKRWGTASYQRWELYDSFIPMREYLDRCFTHGYTRQKARNDVTHDWGRGHLLVRLPDGSYPEPPDLPFEVQRHWDRAVGRGHANVVVA